MKPKDAKGRLKEHEEESLKALYDQYDRVRVEDITAGPVTANEILPLEKEAIDDA